MVQLRNARAIARSLLLLALMLSGCLSRVEDRLQTLQGGGEESGETIILPAVYGPSVTERAQSPLPTPSPDGMMGTLFYNVVANEELVSNREVSMRLLPVMAEAAPVDVEERLPAVGELSAWYSVPAPDGRRIAVIKAREGGVDIDILYADTGKVEPLYRNNLPGHGQFFRWHPDSQQLLIWTQDNYTDVGLWLVDADSGEHTTLVMQYDPDTRYQQRSGTDGVVSPDGQTIAYVDKPSLGLPSELWLIDVDGSNRRRILESSTLISFPQWSPDGSQIAFITQGLMVINADGSGLRPLTYNLVITDPFYRFSWSPDGSTIAFTSTGVPNNERGVELPQTIFQSPFAERRIDLIDVASGETRPLLDDGSSGHIDPIWSPYSNEIAFASIRGGKSAIWVVAADGSNLRKVSNTERAARLPFWIVKP